MRVTKTLISAALAASIATSSLAGGFSPVVDEAPVVIVEPEQERSTWGIVIPLIVVVGLICLATCGSDDDDEPTTAP